MELRRKLNTVEMVADATKWLGMRHKLVKKSVVNELRFHGGCIVVYLIRLPIMQLSTFLSNFRWGANLRTNY
jgi:hypothetical protein